MRLGDFINEETGDERFDKMMNKVTGSNSPSVEPSNLQMTQKTLDLTHKIFLALRDYNDPRITAKFIEFMNRTLDPSVPLDESMLKTLPKK